MKGKNRYYRRSHISEAKFRQIVHLFVDDLSASEIAELTGVSRPTINKLLLKLRIRITQFCEVESPLSDEIEVDESYFSVKRVKERPLGHMGRKKYGGLMGRKTIVFGLLKCQGKAYSNLLQGFYNKSIRAAITRGEEALDDVITLNASWCYNLLAGQSCKKFIGVHHSRNPYRRVNHCIDGIEPFLSYAKKRLVKFNGIPEETFYIHLKECEFRYNNQENELYRKILTILRNNPL